jgi:hypothetical protein
MESLDGCPQKFPKKARKSKLHLELFLSGKHDWIAVPEILTLAYLYSVVGAITLTQTFTISFRPEGVKNVFLKTLENTASPMISTV